MNAGVPETRSFVRFFEQNQPRLSVDVDRGSSMGLVNSLEINLRWKSRSKIVTEVDTVKHFDVNLCDNLPIFWIFTTSTSISVWFPINAVCEPRV